MRPGDYVKIGPNRYVEIAGTYGVAPDGRLAKPSEGGFGVIAAGGKIVGMWDARAYCKRDQLPAGAMVER
jgi:hypothetical protein